MKVAIIGGGLAGCLTALDLAERGYEAVIFDKQSDLILGASLANEGKIHLGYVFSADNSFRTASNLIADALHFRPLVERWIGSFVFERFITETFRYIIPENSKLPLEYIQAHFERVEAHLGQWLRESDLSYLGSQDEFTLSSSEQCPDTQNTLIKTRERAVWPAGIASAIRECVANHQRIETVLNVSIDRVEQTGEKWRIAFTPPSRKTEGPFDIVVNASWADRRNIDRKSGFPTKDAWFTRYKFGVILNNATEVFDGKVPSNGTATTGSFGDSVYYHQNDTLYCSWYPVGMRYTSHDESINFDFRFDQQTDRLMQETWAGYATIDPAYKTLAHLPTCPDGQLVGGFIVARGESDITFPDSQLHERWGHRHYELAKGYWSLDSGKYTSVPRCAADCANAIMQIP